MTHSCLHIIYSIYLYKYISILYIFIYNKNYLFVNKWNLKKYIYMCWYVICVCFQNLLISEHLHCYPLIPLQHHPCLGHYKSLPTDLSSHPPKGYSPCGLQSNPLKTLLRLYHSVAQNSVVSFPLTETRIQSFYHGLWGLYDLKNYFPLTPLYLPS